jgi:rRNA maturation protein Nop10
MSENLINCEDCGRSYRFDILKSCPGCGHEEEVPIPMHSSNVSREAEALQMTTRAIDRTTYAIRSLALFIFISICTSVLGYAIIGAGAANQVACSYSGESCGNGGLVIFGWIVVLVGFVAAIAVGINELSKSKP